MAGITIDTSMAGDVTFNDLLKGLLDADPELKTKLRDMVVVFSNKIVGKIDKIPVETSPIEIDIASILGSDLASSKKMAASYKSIQTKLLSTITKSVYDFRLNSEISIPGMFGISLFKNKAMENKFRIIQNQILGSMQKLDVKEISKTPKTDMPVNNRESRATEMKEFTEYMKTKHPIMMKIFGDKIEKAGKIMDVVNSKSTNENKPGQEAFFEDKPQPVKIMSFSAEALAALSVAMGVVSKVTTKKGKIGAFGEELKDGGSKGFLDGLLTNMFPKAPMGGLLKMGAIAGLLGGLAWMAMDAFKGWAMADQWGTSKVSGALGAALGGSGSGWKNALKNSGKGAAIGLGIGTMIGGPIGAIVGILAGGAIGAILGAIGGEKIAKAFDVVGAYFKEKVWPAIKEFGGWVKDKLVAFWVWIKPILKDVGMWLIEDAWPAIKEFSSWVSDKLVAFWGWVKPILKDVGMWLIEDAWPAIKEFGLWAKEKLAAFWGWLKPVLGDIGKLLIEDVWPAIQKFSSWIGDKLVIFWENLGPMTDKMGKWFDDVYLFIQSIGTGVSNTWESMKLGITNIFDFFVSLPKTFENWLNDAKIKIKRAIGLGSKEETTEEKESITRGGVAKQIRVREQERNLKGVVVDGIKQAIKSGEIPSKAEGGTVTKPTLAFIGEKGTEHIIPDKSMKNMASIDQKMSKMITSLGDVVKRLDSLIGVNEDMSGSMQAVASQDRGSLPPISNEFITSKPRFTEADYLRERTLGTMRGI